MKILPYLKLMRISALPTCWSNVLTAFWLGGGADQYGLLGFLIFVSSLFYLGGMTLNDYWDAELDAVERPERPIPKGEISKTTAGTIAVTFLFGAMGIIAWWVHVNAPGLCPRRQVGSAAMLLLMCILFYDGAAKRIPIVGPITMGLCRFFNILMVLFAVDSVWGAYAVSVFVYITAVTILSGYEAKSLFVRKLVGIGLSSIILIDAVWCLVFVGVVPALVVLTLYPVAMGLRRIVSMT